LDAISRGYGIGHGRVMISSSSAVASLEYDETLIETYPESRKVAASCLVESGRCDCLQTRKQDNPIPHVRHKSPLLACHIARKRTPSPEPSPPYPPTCNISGHIPYSLLVKESHSKNTIIQAYFLKYFSLFA